MKKNASVPLMLLFLFLMGLIISLLSILLYVLLPTITPPQPHTTADTITIASWNLQDFGITKASNATLLNFYATKLHAYDVFVIQELRDPTGEAIKSFAAQFPRHQYILSTPAGQGTSKEQYAIFYTPDVRLISVTDWTEIEQKNFERPPFEATFTVKNWTVTLYTIHIKLNNVPQELTTLEHLIGTPVQDTIIIGDLNADGDQYYKGVLQDFLGWQWVISSEMDTTVAASNHAYDRLIINSAAENNFIAVGIMNNVTRSQSDHYLIYAIFNPNES